MKAYLSDNYQNILTNYYGNKVRQPQINEQAFTNLNKKNNIKLTNQNSKYISQIYQNKQRPLKTESQSISVKNHKNHTRTHTEEINQYKSKDSKVQFKDLNKTYSKKHIKSEIYQANPENKTTSRTKAYEAQENNFLSIVKNRLNHENHGKKLSQNVHLTKLISLAKKSKQLSSKDQKMEISDKQRIQNTKQLHLMMKQEIQNVYLQLTNQQKSNGNIHMCQLLKLLMENIIQLSDGKQKQIKILKVVRQLQEKNIKLLSLINNLKRKGIDVDSYWNNLS